MMCPDNRAVMVLAEVYQPAGSGASGIHRHLHRENYTMSADANQRMDAV